AARSCTGSRSTTRTTRASTARSPGSPHAARSARRRRCWTRFAAAASTARPGRRSTRSRWTRPASPCAAAPRRAGRSAPEGGAGGGRVTLVAGRRRGARVNAGRLGYPHRGRIVERDPGGAIVAARLERPPGTPYGRLVVADAAGGRAWTNALWI